MALELPQRQWRSNTFTGCFPSGLPLQRHTKQTSYSIWWLPWFSPSSLSGRILLLWFVVHNYDTNDLWVCNSTSSLQHLFERIQCLQSIIMQRGWRPASYLGSTNQLHQIPGFGLVNKSIQQSRGHQEDLSISIKLSIHLRALLNTCPLQPCDYHVSLQKQNVNEYSSESFLLHIKNTLCASVPRRTRKRAWRFHSSLKAFYTVFILFYPTQ